MPPQPAIEARQLRKTYITTRGVLRRERVNRVALRGVDLAIPHSELFGLLGPNGAGKTTMVKIFTTLLLPTSGTARVLGLDAVKEQWALRRRIGFVFGGERGLYWRLSGLDNLRYFADLYRIPPEVSRLRIPELLERLGLAGRERDRVELYSRGMKQRLHLARGLLNDPEVLFLDEPTIGLDPVGARELRLIVRELADAGTTIFLTTHYMFEADAICDRIAVIKDGGIVAEGTPNSIKTLVQDQGVVEFEVVGMPVERLAGLRDLPGVKSVAVSEHELAQVVTVHCARPAELMTQLSVIILGKVSGGLLFGLLAFVPTAALAFFGFHAELPALDPSRFVISLAILTFSFLSIALTLTPLFALWRWAFSMLNGFELGVYVLCGFMFPVAVLATWAQGVGSVLGPTWAVRAIYVSTCAGGPIDLAVWWAAAVGLSLLYLVVGYFLYALVEREARRSGELALA